jgi:glutamate carboxypeptidase
MNPLLTTCEERKAWAIDAIESLTRIESPSHDKAAVDRCGVELTRRFHELGAHVDCLARSTGGDHLRAEFGKGQSQILILGHFDTVWSVGQIERMPIVRRDGRLHGPGVFDMKGGIGIALLAIRSLFDSRAPLESRIVVLLTTDEETGSQSSRQIIEDESRRSKAVFVLEPSLPGGAVKTRRKGCGEFHLVVKGISAHAGIEPEKGASAIHELARQIIQVETLQDLQRGISVNVGLVRGGSRTNVVAEEAAAEIDVRVPTLEDAIRIENAIRSLRPALKGTTIEVTGGIDRPPLERTPVVLRLYETAREIAAELGHELGEGGTGGGSDGNFTAAIGVPTLDGLGAIGEGAHALHEHIVIDTVPWRAALVAGLILRVGASTMRL